MSVGLLFDRTVTVLPRGATTIDSLGNEIAAPGTPIPGVRARRRQLTAEEDTDDRDQQARTFVYFLPAGTGVGGRDRLVDDGETFEVVGVPERVYRRRRESHVEARVRLIEG